jgi:hypothetical protein
MQCCPMDTYSGRVDVDGNEVPDCSCDNGCECLCRECRCPGDDDAP